MSESQTLPLFENTRKKTLGDYYWAHADILRGIGIPPATYDQRILAFMAVKLLIDNGKLRFTLEYQEQFGLSDTEFAIYRGKNTQATFRNIIQNLSNFGQNLDYFTQEAKYNPGEATDVLAYVDHPKVFAFTSYIDELPNHYLEMVLDVYVEKADFTDYPKEQYKDLYEITVARMKKLAGDLTGQHFTQKSIIHLMCEVALREIKPTDRIAIYDPACGTGSMVMEAAYYFRGKHQSTAIEVYGQEYSGQLWLLAKIFLEICAFDDTGKGIHNTIAYGNTLTEPMFADGINGEDSFDFIIANPPFGVDWKQDYAAVVKNMASEQPNFLVVRDKNKIVTPKKSDGQLLFMLHIIHLMLRERSRNKRAMAAIITSSTLVSTGSSTGAEAKIRRSIFSERLVSAVVEQPHAMFTNTDISSHVWFLDTQLSDTIKVLKADNEEEALYAPHPRSQDKMRHSYTPEHIQTIVKLLRQKKAREFVSKNLPAQDRHEINIAQEIGRRDRTEAVSLDDLEAEIHRLINQLSTFQANSI